MEYSFINLIFDTALVFIMLAEIGIVIYHKKFNN